MPRRRPGVPRRCLRQFADYVTAPVEHLLGMRPVVDHLDRPRVMIDDHLAFQSEPAASSQKSVNADIGHATGDIGEEDHLARTRPHPRPMHGSTNGLACTLRSNVSMDELPSVMLAAPDLRAVGLACWTLDGRRFRCAMTATL
jgi:hypothetical protein